MDDLRAATTLKDMEYLPGKCHELKGSRKGQFALNLNANLRIVFEPNHEPIQKNETGGIDWEQVKSILIIEIIDYH